MRVVGIDSETHLIRRGLLAPPLVCVSVAWGAEGAPAWVPLAGPDVVRADDAALLGRGPAFGALAAALADEESLLVGANIPYDLVVFAAAEAALLRPALYAVGAGRISDVQVRERLILNARGRLAHAKVGLVDLVLRYLGEARGRAVAATKGHGHGDTWRTRYAELDGIPVASWPEAAIDYPLDDARLAREVYLTQGREPVSIAGYPLVDAAGRVVSEDREVRAATALHLEATYGLRADPEAVDALLAEWETISSAGAVAGRAGGWIRADGARAGTLDKRALAAVVESAYGGSAPRTAPTATFPSGQTKCDTDTLVEASTRPGAPPTLRAYADSLQAGRYLSVWGPALRAAARGALTYRPTHLVATGRVAIADPPLQQPPQSGGMRECFVPRPGFVICSVDYSTAELVALAQVHLWLRLGSTMADAINAGDDLHLRMGAALLRTTYGDAVARYAQGDPEAKRARKLAKVANFGFPGGLGARTFVAFAASAGVVLTDAEAGDLRATWHATWPEMRRYFDVINRMLGDAGEMTVQHPVSGRLRGGVGYTDGCNGYFQGLVADLGKAAAWDLALAGYLGEGHPRAAEFLGSRPILFIHDEILAEVPEARAAEAAEAMTAIMRDAAERHIPDVKMRAEPALMRRWNKNAATVRDPAGRLTVWEQE